MTSVTYHIAGRFHMNYSLLGRAVRRFSGDPRRAETLYIIIFTLLATGLVIVQFLAWSLLQPTLQTQPNNTFTMLFWSVQLGIPVLFLLTCAVGFQPAIEVIHTDANLYIDQHGDRYTLPCSRIDGAEHVSDVVFYRHYRRYRRVRSFVNRLPSTVLLLHTSDGAVALGLAEKDQQALCDVLCEPAAPAEPSTSLTS